MKVDITDPSTTDNAPSGWQNSSVSVILSASDTTSGVSKTYYTTPGTFVPWMLVEGGYGVDEQTTTLTTSTRSFIRGNFVLSKQM